MTASAQRGACSSITRRRLTDADYQRLSELRRGLRAFLRWSAEQAELVGLTEAQHQLLLTIRASRDPRGPTLTDVAAALLIRHHSAVGLVNRAQEAGLIVRERDPAHPSRVHLRLTQTGDARLESLSELHLRELGDLAPKMQTIWAAVGDDDGGRLAHD